MTTLRTIIVLSTAHIEREVDAILGDMGEDTDGHRGFGDWRDPIDRCGYGYGHWVRVPNVDPTDPDDSMAERLEGVPRSLADCLLHAASLGARWVLFDRDEPEIDELKSYTW